MILNVTPEEYAIIKDWERDCYLPDGRFWEGEFVVRMLHRFRCKLFTSYKIVVRKDVQQIPDIYKGVYRMEQDTSKD